MEATEHWMCALPEDADVLRALAHQSEAHWGCDAAFMDTFDRTFNITQRFIAENPVYVLWENGQPAAFWGVRPENGGWELEYFYVSAAALGRGLGKTMWQHLKRWCKARGGGRLHFVTSPQAVGFYEKMGAVQDKTVPSSIDARPIPHFVYAVS